MQSNAIFDDDTFYELAEKAGFYVGLKGNIYDRFDPDGDLREQLEEFARLVLLAETNKTG